ncbi:aldolase [Candidatus Roizmanbacteria bacterium CG_4_10_14_0_8_um_filter_33_9]|uniref:Aldolase n=1 Tax=Candidatus Roizmanbacteria bacterium CG_4_10_14_0_8_um_filter_33_9 TaxID=1974826 RepID=A0A2M7QIY6_9BACT|nr:MAG: aldolase [Candidatus Roizmanbacteria bacterium CG_4_10_14_0_8_um_filter_33_9]
MDIDLLIYNAIFAPDVSVRQNSRLQIRSLAKEKGIYSASIHDLYMSIGKGTISGFTVPAMNIRGMAYDTCRAVFRIAMQNKVGPFIFEIARSEQTYTLQEPDEYTVVVFAAALKEGYKGPVFLQGDHYQFKAKLYLSQPEQELNNIKELINKSISAGFYNIDIDASTLVDLSKKSIDEQQKTNFEMTSVLTEYIRLIQPKDTMVSIGGEIGHIGGKNSTVEDFHAFMKGYKKEIRDRRSAIGEGMSKVSVQTGTSHGGVPLADGSIAKVKLDFNVLEEIGRVAREQYHIGGAVQHGASTLPDELFNQFPKAHTLEIHLATGFQNTLYDNLQPTLKNTMYKWIRENLQKERKEEWTDEQFIYKTRKKAFGQYKKELWSLSEDDKKPIIQALEKQFLMLFSKLNVCNTRDLIQPYV